MKKVVEGIQRSQNNAFRSKHELFEQLASAVKSGEAGTIGFAVSVPKHNHIVICGHSRCGAMGELLHLNEISGPPAAPQQNSASAATSLVFWVQRKSTRVVATNSAGPQSPATNHRKVPCLVSATGLPNGTRQRLPHLTRPEGDIHILISIDGSSAWQASIEFVKRFPFTLATEAALLTVAKVDSTSAQYKSVQRRASERSARLLVEAAKCLKETVYPVEKSNYDSTEFIIVER